jgi:hypothetical protein
MVGFAALNAQRIYLIVMLLALTPVAGASQALPRLHITALGMQADHSVVTPGEAFHVTIHVHVLEQRDRLDELVLPALTNVVDLGDERRRVAAANGTDFYETLTVAADVIGTATFTPAYIDAIDPATGRGMRYSSQPLSVRVVPGTSLADADPGALKRLLLEAAAAVVALGLLLAGGLALLLRGRRRRVAAPPPAPAPPVREAPPAHPDERLRAAFAAYRSAPDDARLDGLRGVLFERAGARAGATFADALQTLGSRDPALLRVMAVAERARFGPAAERAAARADLLVDVEAYVRASESRP